MYQIGDTKYSIQLDGSNKELGVLNRYRSINVSIGLIVGDGFGY
jgi:hypothetical protein